MFLSRKGKNSYQPSFDVSLLKNAIGELFRETSGNSDNSEYKFLVSVSLMLDDADSFEQSQYVTNNQQQPTI